jgi:hypothetical protein
VAELYRWWNTQRGVIANRLFIEAFVIMEPFWTLRLGAAPFWMTFNKIRARYPIPPTLRQFDHFLDEACDHYPVIWIDDVERQNSLMSI